MNAFEEIVNVWKKRSTDTKLRILGVIFFVCCLFTATILEKPFDIVDTNLYFIDHFIFGAGFPFLVYGFSGRFSWGIGVAIFWSVGNEFWEDQLTRLTFSLDWDHFIADIVGILVSWFIYKTIWKSKLEAKYLSE